MGAILKPNQLLGNYIILELARGESQAPSYTPHIVSDMSDAPWPVHPADRTDSMAN